MKTVVRGLLKRAFAIGTIPCAVLLLVQIGTEFLPSRASQLLPDGMLLRAGAEEKAAANNRRTEDQNGTKQSTEKPVGEKDSVDQDYAGELPRIAPRSAIEALKAFHVAPGFRIDLVAAEPHVVDPVAMAFDENGRLYVIEMRDYSEDDRANLGRVRVLTDSNGDGRFDRSSIFADGLSWPTAIACYDGGVFVAAAPEVFYLRDRDGDGVAEEKKHLFTGFARSNVQGLVNSFQWGLDHRLHAATSSSGAAVAYGPDHPLTKSAGKVPPEPVVLRGRDFALDPRTLTIEPTSGGAQHGMSFDNWGTRYVCSNSDHIQQVMFEDRYVARNPYLAAPSPRLSIAADGPQADVFRTSPVEPWRLVRTRLRMKGVIPGVVEGGGRAAGYFTSATGVTIYRGNAWPAEYQGMAIVGDVGGNLVHRKRLTANGIPNVATRVDQKSELLTSDDIWFRPVQFANAPDGGLYIADMYREVIEHPASLHPVIKKHLDLTSGRDRGRIYRLVPTDFEQPSLPKLGAATTAELIQTLAHPNGWHRDTAARLLSQSLTQRRDPAAINQLRELAKGAERGEGRVTALYTLAVLQALSADELLVALADADPHVRAHAVRLAEPLLADSTALRERLYTLTRDDDLRVRYQLAFSLGYVTGPQRARVLATLVKRDPSDNWMRLAIRSSLAEGTGEMLAELVQDAPFRQTAAGRDWLKLLGEQIGKQQRDDDVADLLATLAAVPASEAATLQAILQGVAAKPDSKLATQIAAATGGRASELTAALVTAAAQLALQADQPVAARMAAVQQLRLGKMTELHETLSALLEPAQPAELQQAALAVLGTYRDVAVADLLLTRWPGFSPRLRGQAAEVLFSRSEWVGKLLDQAAAGTVATSDVDPSRWQLLTSHADESIRQRAMALVGKLQTSKRGEVVTAYRDSLTKAGDVARGKEQFKKVCAACHQLEGVGYPTGPNLAAMKNRGPEAILLNVLDPNREVNPQYLNYSVVTSDGRTLSGMIAAETATSVTLKRADNASDTVLRIDIEQLKSTGLSLMPEGMEKQIDSQAMADLLAYLKSVE